MKLSIISAFEAARLQRRLQAPEAVADDGADGPHVHVDGRFRLLSVLGEGSFGAVFLAEDGDLGRRVAVKVMPLGDPDIADREGRALAAIKHPHVVKIFEQGQADDYRWLVLEHLEGPNLRQWCAGKSSRQILARYLEAGEGLDAAHRRGLVHRDFKPSNVRLDEDGHAVVVDFGLARNLESLEGEAHRDGAAGNGGTLVYMAIERLLGRPGDERSDQFAFCAALWEALTGVRPFGDERDVEARLDALSRPPAGAKRIPWRLRKVLVRGLSPLPGDRWPTMTTLLTALRGPSMRSRVLAHVGGATMAGLLAASLFTTVQARSELPSFAVSELTKATLDVVEELDDHDHAGARDALWRGYSTAESQDEKRRLLQAAKLVALHLKHEGEFADAAESWWFVRRLSFDVRDRAGAARASKRIRDLVDAL